MIFLWRAVAERSGDTALDRLEYRLQAARFEDSLRLKAGPQNQSVIAATTTPARLPRRAPASLCRRNPVTSLLFRLLRIRGWFILGNFNLGAVGQRKITFNHHRLAT